MSDMQEPDDIDIPEFGHLFRWICCGTCESTGCVGITIHPLIPNLQAKWDPDSPLTKEQQKRSLVESWTSLGKWGRNVASPTYPYPLSNNNC